MKGVKSNRDNRTFTVLDELPVCELQNGYSIKRGNDYNVEFPRDEVFGSHWIKVSSNFFVVDKKQNVIGYVANGNNKTARCYLMKESNKEKKTPIKYTFPCEFQIDLHTGEISDFSKRVRFQSLTESSQEEIEQYCETLIEDSKIHKQQKRQDYDVLIEEEKTFTEEKERSR